LKVHLAQLNTIVGDLSFNKNLILKEAEKAMLNGADILLTPELSISGYPPEDLLLDYEFINECDKCVDEIAIKFPDILIVIGRPMLEDNKLYNSLSALYKSKVLCTYHKRVLPNYGVFDEKRYFSEGKDTATIKYHGEKISFLICEDVWTEGLVESLVKQGVDIILCINASPFEVKKQQKRIDQITNKIVGNEVALVYLNALGGQDNVVFDGGSFVYDGMKGLIFELPQFSLISEIIDLNAGTKLLPKIYNDLEIILNGLVLALHDYLEKNNIERVFLGLSGGIDSALVLFIATKAIAKKNIHAVMMPSKYTANISLEDAQSLTENLGVNYQTYSIETLINNIDQVFSEEFKNLPADITEENFQARIRGLLLMGLANKHHGMVLATSNKSELAVGYSTIYGDMVGGFCVLKDVPKTMVYDLARHINREENIIPSRIITREPSAELKNNQTDQDTLPSYEILDDVIRLYVEEKQTPSFMIESGFDSQIVEKVVNLINGSEFKRRQSAPGPKITSKAFSVDRRFPITNKYKPKLH